MCHRSENRSATQNWSPMTHFRKHCEMWRGRLILVHIDFRKPRGASQNVSLASHFRKQITMRREQPTSGNIEMCHRMGKICRRHIFENTSKRWHIFVNTEMHHKMGRRRPSFENKSKYAVNNPLSWTSKWPTRWVGGECSIAPQNVPRVTHWYAQRRASRRRPNSEYESKCAAGHSF